MDWETAFFEQYQDACVGRLLRGILHNLNGANQAFSLQAALFRSMFSQADILLEEAIKVCPQAEAGLTPLQELLDKRAVMVEQMEAKVETSQRIVARVLPLSQLYGAEHDLEVSLSTIVDLEMEIMTADAFFKHRIEKRVELAPDLPLLRQRFVEVHTLFYVLLDNALAVMRESLKPVVRLAVRQEAGALVIEVHDSGPGVAPEAAGRIFEPFFSTREGALGVGLYLAKKLVTAMGGTIGFSGGAGDTCFTVALPLTAVA